MAGRSPTGRGVRSGGLFTCWATSCISVVPGNGRTPVSIDYLDALVIQVGMKRLNLLLGDLDLFQAARDLLKGQETSLLPFGDQRAQFLKLRDRRLVGQKDNSHVAHRP